MVDKKLEQIEFERLKEYLIELGTYNSMLDEQVRVAAKSSALLKSCWETMCDEMESIVEEVSTNFGSKRETNPLIDTYEKVHKIYLMDLDRLGLNLNSKKKTDAPAAKKQKTIMERIIDDGDIDG